MGDEKVELLAMRQGQLHPSVTSVDIAVHRNQQLPQQQRLLGKLVTAWQQAIWSAVTPNGLSYVQQGRS